MRLHNQMWLFQQKPPNLQDDDDEREAPPPIYTTATTVHWLAQVRHSVCSLKLYSLKIAIMMMVSGVQWHRLNKMFTDTLFFDFISYDTPCHALVFAAPRYIFHIFSTKIICPLHCNTWNVFQDKFLALAKRTLNHNGGTIRGGGAYSDRNWAKKLNLVLSLDHLYSQGHWSCLVHHFSTLL